MCGHRAQSYSVHFLWWWPCWVVMVEYACISLILTSLVDVLSLICVNPRWLNWSTSSSTFPIFCILVDGLDLMLLTSICRTQQLFSSVFQWDVGILLHCLPADQCHQQTTSCTVVVSGGHWRQWDIDFFLIFCCVIGKVVVLQWILWWQSLLY